MIGKKRMRSTRSSQLLTSPLALNESNADVNPNDVSISDDAAEQKEVASNDIATDNVNTPAAAAAAAAAASNSSNLSSPSSTIGSSVAQTNSGGNSNNSGGPLNKKARRTTIGDDAKSVTEDHPVTQLTASPSSTSSSSVTPLHTDDKSTDDGLTASPYLTGTFSSTTLEKFVPFPAFPAGLARGYVATFYWNDHYPYVPNAANPQALTQAQACINARQTHTEIVASIPNIFHQLIAALQTTERDSRSLDVLGLLDKKIVKPISQNQQENTLLDRKLFHTDSQGNEYVTAAVRKDHLRLIYASAEEGGILARLGLCPMLIDVFFLTNGGKKEALGGAGYERYAVNPELSPEFRCTCNQKFVYKAQEMIKQISKGVQQPGIAEVPSVIQTQSVNTVVSEPSSSVDSSPSAIKEDLENLPETVVESKAEAEADQPLQAENFISTSVSAVRNLNASASIPTAVVASCSQCLASKRKAEKTHIALEKTAIQLHIEMCKRVELEYKWKEEKDQNILLWEKILCLQKQMRDMNRPLSLQLHHVISRNTDTTLAPPPMVPQHMPNGVEEMAHPSFVQMPPSNANAALPASNQGFPVDFSAYPPHMHAALQQANAQAIMQSHNAAMAR